MTRLPRALPEVRLETERYGDSGIMVHVLDGDLETRRLAARRLRSLLLADLPHGVHDLIAGFESVLVEFDCDLVGHDQVEKALRYSVKALSADGSRDVATRQFEVPIVFGGEYGSDLEDVAQELGVTAGDIVTAYTSGTLTVDLLGAAMSPMMHGAPLQGSVSRCGQPRTRVEKGSLMLAGPNAVIFPFPGPSGWRVVGRTPLSICDIRHDPVVYYAPGDLFRFVAVDAAEWPALQGRLLTPAGGQHDDD